MSEALEPERDLAIGYAPVAARAALVALFALDDTLAQILRTTRDPLVGQMRLTWWHGALSALDTAAPPAQPVLQALATTVLPHGVTGEHLAGMIDGWEALLEPEPLNDAALSGHARARGGLLFGAASRVLGCAAADPVAAAGEGWALADLARHVRDPG
uniref:squalene/phytoene synthase family protein n=1 Tax=uncultured Sphingomonas sp. TaxID=158754 RepID=UPI0035CB8D7D